MRGSEGIRIAQGRELTADGLIETGNLNYLGGTTDDSMGNRNPCGDYSSPSIFFSCQKCINLEANIKINDFCIAFLVRGAEQSREVFSYLI